MISFRREDFFFLIDMKLMSGVYRAKSRCAEMSRDVSKCGH